MSPEDGVGVPSLGLEMNQLPLVNVVILKTMTITLKKIPLIVHLVNNLTISGAHCKCDSE